MAGPTPHINTNPLSFHFSFAIMMKWISICAMVAGRTLEDSEIGADLPGDAELVVVVRKGVADSNCEKAKAGDVVHVHYTGWNKKDGSMFDSSVERGEPIVFALGAGMIIAGWDQGVAGMCVGEQRRLIIPSGLAYGDEGAADVMLPGATIIFDVELMEIGGEAPPMDFDDFNEEDFDWDQFDEDL